MPGQLRRLVLHMHFMKQINKTETKLTKAQRKVIELLQRGEVIVHDDRYFQVSDRMTAHRISWKVWQALTQELYLIHQERGPYFKWVLTDKGCYIKL